VRDDKPFAGYAPPAAVFFYSRDRTAQHPERHLHDYAGILQADAYAGFNRLYQADRKPGPITEASCWAHGRRKFFELADVAAKARGKLAVIAPLAFEAVKRIDAIFDIEREINGHSIDERLAARRARVVPLVAELETWMRGQYAKLSRHRMDTLAFRWGQVEIEAAARVAYRAAVVGPAQVGSWDYLSEGSKNDWRKVAGAALEAAECVQTFRPRSVNRPPFDCREPFGEGQQGRHGCATSLRCLWRASRPPRTRARPIPSKMRWVLSPGQGLH
jgi:hypothetical protein